VNAVILVGIQGSGKTTFYRERFFETHVRISLDMLRTRNRERILIDACIAAQQPFVVDNTNVLASDRAVYIGRARAAGFHVIRYFFPPELRASIKRNSIRKDKRPVPVPGVIGTYPNLRSWAEFRTKFGWIGEISPSL